MKPNRAATKVGNLKSEADLEGLSSSYYREKYIVQKTWTVVM